jgi:hypothetical protein
LFEITLRQSFTIAANGSHRARAFVEHRPVLDAIGMLVPASSLA